jgi:hypothetical protein
MQRVEARVGLLPQKAKCKFNLNFIFNTATNYQNGFNRIQKVYLDRKSKEGHQVLCHSP